MRALLPLQAATYRPHPIHASARVWTETNCYVDLWVELLNALGLDPVAGGAFTLSTDFEGDQWTFFKYPPEDLRRLYGIEVAELNVWRPVLDHVEEQLDFGRLLTVEADSWFLPDTAGVSYKIAHTKSTIVPQSVNRADRHLGYFHNAGYFELDGDDFDGVFRLGKYADELALPPYVESVRLDRIRRDEDLVLDAVRLAEEHLARRPLTNPVSRMGERMNADLQWLRDAPLETFHLYAFATCRQSGAAAELAAAFLTWLAERGEPVSEPAECMTRVAESAKALQFTLARIARGRAGSIDAVVSDMAAHWQRGMDRLVDVYGG